jgi:hypothetical protein
MLNSKKTRDAYAVARQYHYRVTWSNLDELFIATADEFPSMSMIDVDAGIAVRRLVDEITICVADMTKAGEPIPEPGALRA